MSLSFAGSPAPDVAELKLVNDPFYPDIEMAQFQTLYRIPAEYTPDLVEHQLALAITRVNDSLAFWQIDQVESGYATLADVPAQQINGESAKVQQYRRAVFCECKAEILKEFETAERKPVAENLAKTGEETEDKYRTFANHAIRQMCSLRRIGVHTV